jgi:hypothetical protein
MLGSLRLDAGGLHHLGPFLGFFGDELTEKLILVHPM